jgi:hypothetical protein
MLLLCMIEKREKKKVEIKQKQNKKKIQSNQILDLVETIWVKIKSKCIKNMIFFFSLLNGFVLHWTPAEHVESNSLLKQIKCVNKKLKLNEK